MSGTEHSADYNARRQRAEQLVRDGDMRIEVVKREINQGALSGFQSSITDYAAALVIVALDSFDEHLATRSLPPADGGDDE